MIALTHCHICDEKLEGDKELDDDHLTGKYRGSSHKSVNINYKIPEHIPVIFHNLANYDAHLSSIKNLGVQLYIVQFTNRGQKNVALNERLDL